MVETKRKNKCIKLLGSIVLGLAFLCLGFFAGFGGKIEEFVKGAGEPTTGGTTNSYENAMIYVDSGATTNITGGSVGAMESGNSVYVADGGTLNVTGGTVSGNIYNGGTLNYTAGTLNSVTLASGKYITFKGNPSSTISITLYGGASVGETVGYLDGITSVTLSRLSVTNLPANTELRIEGGYIKIRYVNRTVTITASPSGYGRVSGSSITIPHGSSVSVSGSTLSYGGTSITATPATQTAQYTYSFDGWYVGDTQITSSRTITANTTITARFTRTTRTYTVTITRNYTSYGTVSRSSVTNVPYGTVLSASSNTLNVNGTTVTATPTTASARYSYSFSNWTNGTATVTGNLTVTANFSRSTRSYYIYAYARYSTSSSGTNSGATAGITGGTATITYGSTDTPTTGSSYVRDYVAYNGTVTLTAEAKTGYVFVGWYSSTTSTSAVSTSSSYSLRITGTTYRYAFFKRASYTITIAVSPSGYGRVSETSVTADYGTSISASGSTLSIGSTDITATPASQTAQYTYSFSSWSNASGTVTGAKTITANFTRTTRTYTVTIAVSPSGYGSVSETSVTADYGTSITTSGSTLSIGDTDITATPASQTAQYTYSFSSWSNASGTVTGAKTITANFTRTTRTYTVTIAVSPSGYGTVDDTSVTAAYGTSISTDGNVLSIGSTDITASPASQTAQYTYSFSSWSNASGTVTGAKTITANFTKTTRTYTVRIIINDTSCGTVSTSSVTNVPYGTVLSQNGNTLNVNGTIVTATPATASAQYTYAFSNWANGTATVTGNLTVTAMFSRSERLYDIYVYARYSTSSSGTNSGATAGVTGGTASITYNSSTSTTTGTGFVFKYLAYGRNVTLTAEAATGYVFVGWYSSTTTTTASSTSSSYSLTVTGTIYRYAFFRRASYTITIAVSPSGYGSVSQTSVTNVPYGTVLSTSGNTLNVNGTTVTATPATYTSQYYYSFSNWTNGTATVTGNLTVTAIFSRTTRSYSIYVYARYSTRSSGTHVSARPGVTGGTASITYGGSTVTTTGESRVSKYVPYGSRVTLTAEAKTGYVFVGWYSSISSTSAVSTSSSYSLRITESIYRYAFFRKAGYTVTFTKTVSAPSTFAPSSLFGSRRSWNKCLLYSYASSPIWANSNMGWRWFNFKSVVIHGKWKSRLFHQLYHS